jgi:hypothetical protein
MTTTTTTASTTTASTTTKRHPIRGLLYGIVFGLGLALIAIGQKWAALGTWPPFLLLLVGIVVGTLWSTLGPAKSPKGTAPEGTAPEDTARENAAPDDDLTQEHETD